MFYTYVIRSNKDRKLYTGRTNNLQERFKQHNNGEVFSTNGGGPFELIYYEACNSEKDAYNNREKYLKTGMGKRYLKNRLKRSLSLAGFTTIELIIVVLLLAFGIIGIYGFFHPTLILTSNFSLRFTADYLAQEGMEIVKNIRDKNIIESLNWDNKLSGCDSGCQLDYKTETKIATEANKLKKYIGDPLNLNSDGFYSYDSGKPSVFKRKITITKPSNKDKDVFKVNVLVTWDYRGKQFQFETIGYIYNL